MDDKNAQEFSFSFDSKLDGKNYAGKFKVKIRLSHREQLAIDQRRRQILGNDPNNAAPLMNQYAFAIASLQVRCLEAPSWFRDNGYGLDLEDTELLMAVFNEVYEREEAYRKELSDAADAARASLRAETEKK